MKHLFTVIFVVSVFAANGQVQKEDGTWWDNNLEFNVQFDALKEKGQLAICIYDSHRDMCIENVMTSYEVRIYNAANQELWNALWTGKNMDMVFKKNFPEAAYVVIKAMRPFVVNKMTGTRIYQDQPMELKFTVKWKHKK